MIPQLYSYFNFVNFGKPPHYLGLQIVRQKVRNFAEIS